ncbi:MAG: hypothetical protein H7Y11_12015 [Armatimonadetes bacterium]|nr:hypothetical protein [Anaerolineae bacterium]
MRRALTTTQRAARPYSDLYAEHMAKRVTYARQGRNWDMRPTPRPLVASASA